MLTNDPKSQPDGVHLVWTKYTGPHFSYYGIVRSEGTPTLSVGQVPGLHNTTDVNARVYIDTAHLAPGTYHYKLWAFSEQTFGGNVIPNCTVGTILAESNIVEVTIPATASPTPARASAAPSASAHTS